MNAPISGFGVNGFYVMPYRENIRKAVGRAIEQWKKFCGLPAEVKLCLPCSSDSAGVGYEHKDGGGDKGDRKENLDVTLAGKAWLEQYARAINNPAVLGLLEGVTALVGMLKPIIVDFAQQVQEFFNVAGLASEVERSEDTFFVRFIHYPGDRRIGEEIAIPHVDQSGFTLHLFETAPGLQRLMYEGDWIDMPVSDGQTVIIPAMQIQLRSEGQIKALCHRVIATQESADAGRYSAVCFVQLKQTPKYDREAQGRLQQKVPGFNYGLPHDRFANLFKR